MITKTNLDTVEEYWSLERYNDSIQKSNLDSIEIFREKMARYLSVDPRNSYFFANAHSGFEWILRSIDVNRRTVLLPAFNCPVVFDSVIASGYKVGTYDFSGSPGMYDWEDVIKKISPTVGVLVITHFFGVPVDFREILNYCRSKEIVVIEDCAHTLGATIDGQMVGSIGDASFFSFNYDKPISLAWGGFAVINNTNIFNLTKNPYNTIPSSREENNLFIEFLEYIRFRRANIGSDYKLFPRITNRLRLSKNPQFSNTSNYSVGTIQAELGLWCLDKYSEILKVRNTNASRLRDLIPQRTWPVAASVQPAWLKQKVYIEDVSLTGHLVKKLQKIGIRVGNYNWPDISGINDFATNPVSLLAATNWIDVPVHQNMTDQHFFEIKQAFFDIL